MDNQLITQIEQQIEMLQANINVQQAQVTYLKSMIVILKQQAQTPEPTIGKFTLDQPMPGGNIAIDLPKDIKLPDQASQALDNWVKDAEKEQKKEPSNVKAPKEKKVKLIGGKRSYYRGLNKKMRYEPDLVRQFVDAYNSMQATGKYSKTETLDKIMRDFNLTCCVETLRKCIFFHDKYQGYEDIPTPPTDPALMPTISNPVVLDRVKSTKWLCRFGLNNGVIAGIVGVSEVTVSNIRNGITYQNVLLTSIDDTHYHREYDDKLKEMGVTPTL